MPRSKDDLKKIIANLLETEGRTKAETENYKRKAAQMMYELGLTREEILVKNPDMCKVEIHIGRFDWIVTKCVFAVICDLTDVHMFHSIKRTSLGKRSDLKILYFCGYRSDVDQATWLLSHILSKAAESSQNIRTTSERNSYLVGFGTSITHNIKKLIRSLRAVQKDESAKTGKDLVLKEKAQIVKEYVNKVAPNLVTSTGRTSIRNTRAMSAGMTDGNKVSLGRGVSQGAKAITQAQ